MVLSILKLALCILLFVNNTRLFKVSACLAGDLDAFRLLNHLFCRSKNCCLLKYMNLNVTGQVSALLTINTELFFTIHQATL